MPGNSPWKRDQTEYLTPSTPTPLGETSSTAPDRALTSSAQTPEIISAVHIPLNHFLSEEQHSSLMTPSMTKFN